MTTSTTPTAFRAGDLVTCRQRDWVVQNGSTGDVLRLKPLAGADDDLTVVLPALEPVTLASFDPPTVEDLGHDSQVRLLEQAFRVSNTDPAGPFRGFGRMAVRPRPYQLVPLLMALRQIGTPNVDEAYDAVRLLISDDVGIGKTVESLLVANELLTTGEADGLAVVCPPHLADQWVGELRDKFHLDAVKVVPSTVKRLEKHLTAGESLFQRHRITVVSMEWVKSKRRRDEFASEAPNLVIVDEAHLCAKDSAKTGKHLRHELLTRLASERLRHLVLVTATPHSGKDGAFLSLVGLLHPTLARIDEGREFTDTERTLLARHFVARKRVDVAEYQGDDDTVAFPNRAVPTIDGTATDFTWTPPHELSSLITEVIDWARPRLSEDTNSDARDRRVWWWSILGLGRALGSSPRAAAASLRSRAGLDVIDTADEVDVVGRATVTDADLELDDVDDATPGAVADPNIAAAFAAFADRVEALEGIDTDPKAALAAKLAKSLLAQDISPIFFCQFIHTAEYLAETLADVLDGVEVRAVTGNTPPDIRAADINDLTAHDKRVLVATDCLSEGINLQTGFDAVIHYDLPWSPTRLEQREGRVDRYGQPSDTVYITTLQGTEPTLDPFIQTHLIDKHNAIKSRLGFSIPVPGVTDDIIDEAASIWFGRKQATLFDTLGDQWEAGVADQVEQAQWVPAQADSKSRAKYAQRTIRPNEVSDIVREVAAEVGTPADVARFVGRSLQLLGADVTGDLAAAADPNQPHATAHVAFGTTANVYAHHTIAAILGVDPSEATDLTVRFIEPAPRSRGGSVPLLLSRTHPVVNEVARRLIDPAMDPKAAEGDTPRGRVAVLTTDAVDTMTVLVTCRLRFDVDTRIRQMVKSGPSKGTYETRQDSHLVEQIVTLPLVRQRAADGTVTWTRPHQDVHPDRIVPTADTAPQDRDALVARVVVELDQMQPALVDAALERGELLEDQHTKARGAFTSRDAGAGIGTATVHPHQNVDVLTVLIARPDQNATR